MNDSGGSVSFVFVYRERERKRESTDLLRVIIEFLYGMCIVHTFLLDFHVILITILHVDVVFRFFTD